MSDSWAGKRESPLDLAKHPREYLQEVEVKLKIGQEYAEKHAIKAQKRYADYYNSKSSNKQFEVGEQVIFIYLFISNVHIKTDDLARMIK